MSKPSEPLLLRLIRRLDPLGWADAARPRTIRLFIILAFVMIVLDQLSKLAAVLWLKTGPPVEIVPGYFRLIYVTNTGAAFSAFSGQTMMLTAVSFIISVVLIYWALKLPDNEKGLRLPLGLILGGAIGNLIDRARLGEVIDFLDVHWKYKYHWPTFNIADSAVCIGVFLLIVANIVYWLSHPKTDSASVSDQPIQDESSS